MGSSSIAVSAACPLRPKARLHLADIRTGDERLALARYDENADIFIVPYLFGGCGDIPENGGIERVERLRTGDRHYGDVPCFFKLYHIIRAFPGIKSR